MADRERRAEAKAISPLIIRGVSSKMPRLYVRRPHEDLKPGCLVGATYEFRMEPPKDALESEKKRKPQLPPPRMVKHTVAQLLHDQPELRAVALAKGMTQEDIDEMVASYAKASLWQPPQVKPEAYKAKRPVEPSTPKVADAPKQPSKERIVEVNHCEMVPTKVSSLEEFRAELARIVNRNVRPPHLRKRRESM
jgi:hypothetical protein